MYASTRSIRLLTALVLCAPGIARAQALRPTGDPARTGVALEIVRPALDRNAIGADLGFATSVHRLELRLAAGGTAITATVPYSLVSVPDADFSSTLVGNLGFGVELGPDQPIIAGFEVLVPTASGGGDDDGDLATVAGLAADYGDLEVYVQDVLSMRGKIGYRWRHPSGLTFRLATRPALLIPTGALSGDPELFVDYAAQLDYAAGRWVFGGALNGRVLVTEEVFFFGRVVHTMDVGAAWRVSPGFRPGVMLRLPLDGDLGDIVGISLGISLEFPLGRT